MDTSVKSLAESTGRAIGTAKKELRQDFSAQIVESMEPVLDAIVAAEKRIEAVDTGAKAALADTAKAIDEKIAAAVTKADMLAAEIAKIAPGVEANLAPEIGALRADIGAVKGMIDVSELKFEERLKAAEDQRAALEKAREEKLLAEIDVLKGQIADQHDEIARLKRNDQHSLLESAAMRRLEFLSRSIRDRTEAFLHARTSPEFTDEAAREDAPWLNY